ncbi:MAG: thiol-activated cytolysin family protein [Myxococcota bacterium]
MDHAARRALALTVSLAGCNAGAPGRDGSAPFGVGPGLGEETEDESDDGVDTAAPETDLDAWIYGLGYLGLPQAVAKTELPCDADECPDGQEGQQYCTYTRYAETGHFDEFVAFQPDSVALWPGAIVEGEDAAHGLLTPIIMPRAPLSYSVSLMNLNGTPVAEMLEPSLSQFRDSRNALLAVGTTGEVDAKLSFELERVHNESHMSLSIGTSVGWGGVKLANLFEFDNELRQTKILADFTQAYYTIDVEPPAAPSDLFSEDVAVEDLEAHMAEDNPPMYVQSITYGRRVLFALESTYSEQEVRNAFAASYDALFVSAGVDVDVHSRTVLESSRIAAFVLGGAATDAVKVVGGVEGLMDFLVTGAGYSAESPGSPIGYKLSYLDNADTKLALSTDYTEKTCVGTQADVLVSLRELKSVGGVESNGSIQVYGQLQARFATADDPDPCRSDAPDWTTIFDRADDEELKIFNTWVPPSPLEETVYDVDIAPDAQMCLRGWMAEEDTGGIGGSSDDDMGQDVIGPITFEHGWTGSHVLQFVGGGAECHATIEISM